MNIIDTSPRPHSYDRPKVPGYRPLIRLSVERVARGANGWRANVLIDDCPMATSYHKTKESAMSHGANVLSTYAEVHYYQV